MRKYLLYLNKKRLPIYLTFLVALTLILLVWNRPSEVYYLTNPTAKIYGVNSRVMQTYLITYGISICLIPFFEFAFKMDKKSANQLYSLPLKREKLYLSHFITGYLEVTIPYIIAFFISFVTLLIGKPEVVIYQNQNVAFMVGLLPFLGVLLLIGLIAYSFEVFFYCQANNVIDGILTVIMASFVLWPVSYAFLRFAPNDFTYSICYSMPYLFYSSIYVGELAMFGENSFFTHFNAEKIGLIINIVLGIACFVGQYFASKHFKAENAGQRSESWFCYKILLPVISIAICFQLLGSIVFAIMIVGTYLAYVLYKRKFNLGTKTWIIFAITVALEITAYVIERTVILGY